MPTATAGKQSVAPFSLLAWLPIQRGKGRDVNQVTFRDHHFYKLRPLTGRVLAYPIEALQGIATKARRILIFRTEEQIKGASDTIVYLIKEYFDSAEAYYIEGLLENGGFPLQFLDEEYRNENGIKDLLDNWPTECDDPRPFSPNDENTSDLEALQNCIDGYALEDDVEFPDGKDFEYFAILALWKIEEIQELQESKNLDHCRKITNAAIEAMESICFAEILKYEQDFSTASDDLRIQLKQSIHSYEQNFDSKVSEKISLKAAKLAKSGGDGRASKFKPLEAETIRLFNAGSLTPNPWTTSPEAALEITPKIVAMSRDNKGNLSPSTTKPLEWIRSYIKSQKSNLS